MFEKFVPIMFFILTLVLICCFLSKIYKLNERFNKNRDNRKFLFKIYEDIKLGIIPSHNPKDIETALRRNDTVGHKRENVLKSYRCLYHWILAYNIFVFAIAALWVVYVVADIFVCKWTHSETIATMIVGTGVFIFGVGLPPVLKSAKNPFVKKAAVSVDKFMHYLFDMDGKLSSPFLEISYTGIMLIINTFTFLGYLSLGEYLFQFCSLESYFVYTIFLLMVYRYLIVEIIFVPVIHFLFTKADCLLKRKRLIQFQFSRSYIQDTLTNNTYLTFLFIYVVGKGLFVDPTSVVGITIEAIGVVYLLDTYIEAHKKARTKRMQETEYIES